MSRIDTIAWMAATLMQKSYDVDIQRNARYIEACTTTALKIYRETERQVVAAYTTTSTPLDRSEGLADETKAGALHARIDGGHHTCLPCGREYATGVESLRCSESHPASMGSSLNGLDGYLSRRGFK